MVGESVVKNKWIYAIGLQPLIILLVDYATLFQPGSLYDFLHIFQHKIIIT